MKNFIVIFFLVTMASFAFCKKNKSGGSPDSPPTETVVEKPLESWKLYRGVNVSPDISRTNLEDLALYGPR